MRQQRRHGARSGAARRALALGSGVAVAAGLLLPAPAGAVVGGSRAELGDHPWQVALLDGGQQVCGGAIVAPDLVLTAAHCVETGDADGLTARAGTVDLRDRDGQERDVDEVEVFEGYDPSNARNDIALLRLGSPFDVDDVVAPITLAGRADLDAMAAGRPAVVSGFGATDEDASGGSPVLLDAELEIVDDEQCVEWYLEDGDDDVAPGVNVCAGLVDGAADSCYGDSGGPLVVDADDGPRLLGLVSWGAGCGVAERPTVHAEVPAFYAWLDERGVPGVPEATTFGSGVDDGVRIPARGTEGKAERYPLAIDVEGIDGPVADVDVELRGLTHSRVEDLRVRLVAPDGTVVTLLAGVDAGSVDDATVTFDAAGTDLDGVDDLAGGRWRPAEADGLRRAGPEGPSELDLLQGVGAEGRWRLLIADGESGEHGSLESWALVLR